MTNEPQKEAPLCKIHSSPLDLSKVSGAIDFCTCGKTDNAEPQKRDEGIEVCEHHRIPMSCKDCFPPQKSWEERFRTFMNEMWNKRSDKGGGLKDFVWSDFDNELEDFIKSVEQQAITSEREDTLKEVEKYFEDRIINDLEVDYVLTKDDFTATRIFEARKNRDEVLNLLKSK